VTFAAGRFAESADQFRKASGGYKLKSEDWLFAAAVDDLLVEAPAMAAQDLEELNKIGFRVPSVDARRALITGGLEALAGNDAAALEAFGRARTTFHDIGMAFDDALAGIVMASLLDPGRDEVALAVERAREILVGLRANALLRLLDEAVERGSRRQVVRTPAAPASSPAG